MKINLPHGQINQMARSFLAFLNGSDRIIGRLLLVFTTATFGLIIFFLSSISMLVLLRDYSMDDAFYYLNIARHLAETGVPTFDGINLTNGFHWLWQAMLIPIFWLGLGNEESFFLMKAIEILINAGSIVLLYKLFKNLRIPLYLLFIPIVLILSEYALYQGMETAISLFTLIGSALVLTRSEEQTSGRHVLHWLIAGLWLSLAFFARLENIVFSLLAPLVLLISYYLRQKRFKPVYLLAEAAVILSSLLYLSINYLVFDTPTSISSQFKSYWCRISFDQSPHFTDNLFQLLQISYIRNGCLAAILILSVVALGWLISKYRTSQYANQHRLDSVAVSMALYQLIKTLAYALFGCPKFTNGADYNIVTFILCASLLMIMLFHRLPLLLTLVTYKNPQDLSGISIYEKSARIIATLCILLVITAGSTLLAKRYLNYYRMSKQEVTPYEEPFDWASYLAAKHLNSVLPESAIVGGWDSGVFGYFSDFTVVNLDGLVNSRDYFEMVKEGRQEEYLQQTNIEYLGNLFPVDTQSLPFIRQGRLELIWKQTERPVMMIKGKPSMFQLFRYIKPENQ